MIEGYICDEFKALCKSNFRDIKNGKTCYIYRDDVLKETKELCDKNKVKYYVKKVEDYYKLISLEKKGAYRY